MFERGAWPMARSGFYFGLQDSAGQGWVFEAETADARKDWLWLLAVRGADFSGVQSRRVFPAAHAEGYLRVQGSKRFKTVWETAYCVLHADSLMVFKDWRKAHAGKEQLSLKFSGSTRVSALEVGWLLAVVPVTKCRPAASTSSRAGCRSLFCHTTRVS